jgi:zinc/manganese transport system substrate-binding protein
MMRARFFLSLCLVLTASPLHAAERLNVVASFSILGDFVRTVGGDNVNLTTLVGADSDVHVYTPTPSDAKTVADARLLVVNGLGLEGWLPRLLQSSASKAQSVAATTGIAPLKLGSNADPHAWQSVANAKLYVANHDAFGYFAAAYGVAFIAPLGVSTETEPSARDIAKIIAQVRAEKIPAVFLENISDDRLVGRIAAETGARIGGTLFSDSLTGEKGDAPTYIAMVRHNIKALTSALDH